jgi:predicted secreted Zn-dependent protease
MHFNISRLCALQLKKEIRETSFKVSSHVEVLNTMFNKVIQNVQNLQRKYDEETSHGLNKKLQALWEKRIMKEINDLEASSS